MAIDMRGERVKRLDLPPRVPSAVGLWVLRGEVWGEADRGVVVAGLPLLRRNSAPSGRVLTLAPAARGELWGLDARWWGEGERMRGDGAHITPISQGRAAADSMGVCWCVDTMLSMDRDSQ